MKLITVLPLAAISIAFVIVDEAVLNDIAIETKNSPKSIWDKLPSKDEIFSHLKDAIDYSGNAFDDAINAVTDTTEEAVSAFQCHSSMTAFDTQSWLESTELPMDEPDVPEEGPKKPRRPPHHRKPRHGHHGKPNMTIWEMISKSKYTTRLAKLISEYDDLVDVLNGTTNNFTLFAPTDKAFEKIPDHHKKPDKQTIRNILAYHVSPSFYPARRILFTHTIPSTYHEVRLGDEPQRLRVGASLFKGLNINFFSKIIAANIFATNGVIHAVDTLILPPPPVLKIIELLPGDFSTLQLALSKTGLLDIIKDAPHSGGTLFAPTNGAFKKLGPKINAFLFSKYGEKYLKAILEYHVVANETLYSDAFYKEKDEEKSTSEVDDQAAPRRTFHIDLPTLLDGKSLSIDIARWGAFIDMEINGFTHVAVQDGLAADGVIQVLSNVLIPPKTPHSPMYQGEDLTVEDLKERLNPFVQNNGWWDL